MSLFLKYSISICALIAAQVVITSFAFKHESMGNKYEADFDKIWDARNNSVTNQKDIGKIEQALKCCGRDGPIDYYSEWIFPLTCCPDETLGCDYVIAFRNGCKIKFREFYCFIGKITSIISSVFVAFEVKVEILENYFNSYSILILLQFICFLCGCCLWNNLRKSYQGH